MLPSDPVVFALLYPGGLLWPQALVLLLSAVFGASCTSSHMDAHPHAPLPSYDMCVLLYVPAVWLGW